VYWLSWLLAALTICTIASLLLICTGAPTHRQTDTEPCRSCEGERDIEREREKERSMPNRCIGRCPYLCAYTGAGWRACGVGRDVGLAVSLDYFTNTDFVVNFVVFFLFTAALIALAAFTSVFVSKAKSSRTPARGPHPTVGTLTHASACACACAAVCVP
jgi:hypothetical protein